MEPAYPTIEYESADFAVRLAAAFREYGVVAITGVFSPAECEQRLEGIVSDLERLAPALDRNSLRSWTRDNTPPQTRTGLFQAVVGNLADVWRVRADPRVRHIFEVVYSALRGRPVDDFIASGDGLNIQPNSRGPYHKADGPDWAHLDQTRGDPFACVQGQVVLTETTACLRAWPRSHLAFGDILAATGGEEASNWRHFDAGDYGHLRALVEARGGTAQVPIRAPRGSVLLWASSLVHSAQRADGPEPPDPRDPWRGWRGVVYVCYRPRAEFTPAQRRKRWAAFEGNRTTNHRATKIFPTNPCARWGPPPAGLRFDGGNYVTSPAAVYGLLGRPPLDRAARRLAGHSSESSSEEEEGAAEDEAPEAAPEAAPVVRVRPGSRYKAPRRGGGARCRTAPHREAPPAVPLTDLELEELLSAILSRSADEGVGADEEARPGAGEAARPGAGGAARPV